MSQLSITDVSLTSDETNLLLWFREMDLRRKGETLALAELDASKHPHRQPLPSNARPTIRLVSSSGKAV